MLWSRQHHMKVKCMFHFPANTIQSQFGGMSATDCILRAAHMDKMKKKKKKNMTQGKVNNSNFFFLLVCCCCYFLRWKYWPVTVIHHFNYIYIDRFINFHSNFCAQTPHIYINMKYDSFRCWSCWIFVCSDLETRAVCDSIYQLHSLNLNVRKWRDWGPKLTREKTKYIHSQVWKTTK